MQLEGVLCLLFVLSPLAASDGFARQSAAAPAQRLSTPQLPPPPQLSVPPVPGGLLGTNKRCPRGYEVRYDKRARKYECRCKRYHLYWPGDGLCYREYHRGPCPEGHR